MLIPGLTLPDRGAIRLHTGDRCPECGEPLVRRFRRSVLALFRKRIVLRCPVCKFVAIAQRGGDRAVAT
jgi:hypothetical protein